MNKLIAIAIAAAFALTSVPGFAADAAGKGAKKSAASKEAKKPAASKDATKGKDDMKKSDKAKAKSKSKN